MRVSQNLILIPALVQMLIPLVILPLMGRARGRSMAERRQSLQDMALASKTDWNEQAQKYAASFANQFELPVIFYALTAFALITRMVDPAMLVLASLFALSRVVHAIIHIGPNVVVWRFSAYLFGVSCLVVMWGLLTWRVLTIGL